MAEIEVGLDGTEVLIIGAMDNTDIVEVAAVIGPPGPRGFKGDKGTIEVGSVSTGTPGTEVVVVDTSDDDTHAIFDFTIPRGDKGETGTLELGNYETGAPYTDLIITNTGTPEHGIFNFTIPRGDKGETGTLELGSYETGAAYSELSITNTGTPEHGVFNFVIPRGDKGETGTLELGTFTTGAPGSNVEITNTGTPENGIFNFIIPRGDKGATGTLSLGSVTTGAPGTNVAITNTGTPEEGILNFTIPRGDKGATGTLSLGTVTTGAAGSDVEIINTGTPEAGIFNFTIPRGDRGIAATIAVGTVTTLAPGASAAVVNSGTAADARFDFSIPQGPQGVQGFKGDKGDRGTIALGTVTTTNPGTNAAVVMRGTASDGIVDFSFPRGAGVQVGGTTGQYLRKASNADFDTTWVDIPAPINMVTTDTAQTITGAKTFSLAPVVPDDSFTIAKTAGLQATLDSKYSAENPQPMTGYATTAEVDSRINGIIDAAPGTLDTLNELAAALGDDPNFATTVTNNINTRALDADVVHLAGTETITGTKTFSGPLYTGFMQATATGLANVTARFRTAGAGATGNITEWIHQSAILAYVTPAGAGHFLGGVYESNSERVFSNVNKVPASGLSATGTPSATTFLRGDNTWATVDLTNLVTLSTAQTITGAKTFSGQLRATGNVVETEQGIHRLDLGVVNTTGGTARVVFEDPTATAGQRVWQIDTSAGAFRWYTPGAVKMSLSAAGALNTAGAITQNNVAVVLTNDSRMTNARTPTAHTHGVTDLTATGTRDATTYLRGDNTWATITIPTNSVTTDTIQTITATKTFAAATATSIPVITTAAAGQTANLHEWRDSAGTVLTRVASDGRIYVNNVPVGAGAGNASDTEILSYMGAL